MDYLKHYKHLIRKARNRQLPKDTYVEKHHIIPKCLLKDKPNKIKNGKWNLVKLTAREHFIAHQLLYFYFRKIKHAHTNKIFYAWMMFFKDKGQRHISSSEYETLRKFASKNNSGKNNPMYGKPGANKGKFGKLNHMYGVKRPEHSIAMSGKNHPMYGKVGYWDGKVGPNKGKKRSEEAKKKTSEKMREMWRLKKLSLE